MKLAEIYRQILLENINVDEIEKRYLLHVYQLWQQLLNDFPVEPGINNPQYMDSEIERSSFMYDIHILEVLRKMKSSTSVIRQKKVCSKIKQACYYNSLNYMKLYDDEDVDLAWGICADTDKIVETSVRVINQTGKILNGLSNFKGDGIVHAFLVNNKNQIIDPTLGTSYSGWTYYYEIVPRDVWKKFSHKFDDEDFDARDFADVYIKKRAQQDYGPRRIIDEFVQFANSKQ